MASLLVVNSSAPRDDRLLRRWVGLPAMVAVKLAASLVLILLAMTASSPSTHNASASGLGSVRTYYATLNALFVSGESDALPGLFAQDARIPLPGQDADLAPAGLEMHLSALRVTYPDLHVSLLDVYYRAEDRLVAEIELRYGTAASPAWLGLDQPGEPVRALESFQVTGGTIVEYQTALFTAARYSALLHEQTATQLVREGRLTAASISLPAKQVTYLRLPGPGFVLVREGVIEVAGDVTYRASASPGEPATWMSDEIRLFSAGAMISSAVSDVVLRNPSASDTTIELVALVTPTPMTDSAAQAEKADWETRGDGESTVERKIDASMWGTIGEPIRIGQFVVTPLFRTAADSPIGIGTMETGIVWLPPGASVQIDERSTLAVSMDLTETSARLLQAPTQVGTTVWFNSGRSEVRLIVARHSASQTPG